MQMDTEEIRKEMPVAVLLQEHQTASLPFDTSIDEFEKLLEATRKEIFATGAQLEHVVNASPVEDAREVMGGHVTAITGLYRSLHDFLRILRRHQESINELVARVALKYIARGGGLTEIEALHVGSNTVAVAMDNPEVVGLTSTTLPRVIRENLDDDFNEMDED